MFFGKHRNVFSDSFPCIFSLPTQVTFSPILTSPPEGIGILAIEDNSLHPGKASSLRLPCASLHTLGKPKSALFQKITLPLCSYCSKNMKKIFFLLLGWLILFPLQGQTRLSDEAQISLLTSAPYDEEVFTVYGHAAIRIYDPQQKLDIIFNYGLFDFAKPHFIYRFAKGETDYKLGAADFSTYILEYQLRGSDITEQTLNLTPDEKARLWEALLVNYRPENRTYRYNFFFDNCATRPAVLIEKAIHSQIDYQYPYAARTFRELINYCTRNHPWLTFGCDLALGSPTDRPATLHEMMFLPSYLEKAFGKATVTNPDGTKRKLVKDTRVIGAENRPATPDISETAETETGENGIFTPIVVSWLFFGIIFVITFIEWRRRTYYRIVDCLLFFLAGTGGVILFFLSFISVHPSTWPNWNLIWLQPLDWVAVILFSVKKLKKAAFYYHFINFAALTAMLLGWTFIPQHLNTAFIPLVASIWLRSGYGVYRKIWKIG